MDIQVARAIGAFGLALSLLVGASAVAQASSHPDSSTEPIPGQLISCDGRPPGFPIEQLGAPTGAEKAVGPIYDGLRSAIKTMRSEFMFEPRGDRPHRLPWLLAYQDDDRALFLVQRKRGNWEVMTVEREGDTWGFGGYGGCHPRPLIVHEYGESVWRVKESAPPAPEDTSIGMDVMERACASGQSASGRIVDPIIEYTVDSITITVPVRDLIDVLLEERIAEWESKNPGTSPPPFSIGVNCPGNPWTPYVAELSEPIGDRVLLDGGPFPPEQRWPEE